MTKVFKQLDVLLYLLLFIGSSSLYAQKNGIKIYGTYHANGGSKSSVKIRLLRNGGKETSSINGNGKFEYNLEFNNQYELQFSKKGYITKKVVISTDVPERVLVNNSDFPPFKIEVELFPKVAGGDYTIFDEPVALIIYDKELDDFDFDRAYNAEVEKEIQAVEAKIVSNPIVVELSKKTQRYEKLIAKADQEFSDKSYVNAQKIYKKALKIKPRKIYPQARINFIGKILESQEKRAKQQAKNKVYYTLIDKANIFLENKKYTKARSHYEKSSEIKPEEQYPKDKIKLINQIIAQKKELLKKYNDAVTLADRYFQENKYELAHKSYKRASDLQKDEKYPQEQIKKINRLQKELELKKKLEIDYTIAIEKADSLFVNENWFESKESYKKASLFFPKKRYAQKKMKEIDDILNATQKILIAYSEIITKADGKFKEQNWELAQKYYEKALAIKPKETYPQTQIELIRQKQTEQKIQHSVSKAYLDAIRKADRIFLTGNWEIAQKAYFDALKIKPKEEYPSKQLFIIKQKIKDLATKLSKKELYNKKIQQADMYYAQKEWEDAISYYQAASALETSESYPKTRITKIVQLQKFELEKLTAQKRKIRQQKSYKSAIQKADTLYKKENWIPAIAMYEKAWDTNAKEEYPKLQIDKIKATLLTKQQAKEGANKQHYKKLAVQNTSKHRYYQKLKPKPETQKRYAKSIDATQVNEAKYNALMKKAKEQKSLGNFPFARAYYRLAFLEKPSTQLLNKLKQLDRLTKTTNKVE